VVLTLQRNNTGGRRLRRSPLTQESYGRNSRGNRSGLKMIVQLKDIGKSPQPKNTDESNGTVNEPIDLEAIVDCSGYVRLGIEPRRYCHRIASGCPFRSACWIHARISLRNSGWKSVELSKTVVARAWAHSKMVATEQIARFASAALVSLGKLSRTPRSNFTSFPATWISVDEIQRAKFGLLVSRIPPRWKGLCAIYAHAASAP